MTRHPDTTETDRIPVQPPARGLIERSREKLSSSVRALGKWSPGAQGCSIALCILITVQVLAVSALALSHKPWFSFDESNTIRIASQPWGDISEVLSYDQNFPPYYQLLHVLFGVFGASRFTAIGLNLAVWLLGVFTFAKIAGELLGKGPWRLFATLCYTFAGSLFLYSFYIRMYGILNVCVLGAMLGLLRHVATDRRRWLVASGLCIVVAGAFHPTGAVLAVLFLAVGFFLAKTRRDFALYAVFCAAGLAAALVYALQKPDLRRIYLGAGIEYVKVSSTPFHVYLSRLLFKSDDDYSWMLFAAGAVFLVEFFRRTPLLSRKFFPLTFFTAIFAALPLVLSSFANSHHFYFLSAPVLLALSLGVQSLTAGGARLKALILVLPCLLGWQSYTFAISWHRGTGELEMLASELKKMGGGAILCDFILYNTVEYAVPPGSRKVVMMKEYGAVDVTHFSLKQMLIVQAELGGLSTSGVLSGTYRAKLRKALSDEKHPIDREIDERLAGEKDVCYVLPPNRSSIFPEELQLLNGYRFKKLLKPSIYCFARVER